MKRKDFAYYLTEFLTYYLPELRNISGNTISSYCDTFRFFLSYCRDIEKLKIEKFTLSDFTPELVERFIGWLKTERSNSVATCNQRLGAIHSFAQYVQYEEPKLLLNFSKILDIPVGKIPKKAISPLTKETIGSILRQPDIRTKQGRRDAMILGLLYDTAARSQELCDLRVGDVRLENPATVRILGKGSKTRTVPILPHTVQNLKNYLSENHLLAPEKSHYPLFANRNGGHLTRAGLSYILKKYVKAAAESDGGIPKKISPHIFRHSKAMHSYESGNTIIQVRDFLGHTDVKTTDIYARTSLKMKQQALEKISDSPVPDIPSWVENRDMLTWLKNFGSQKS